MGQKVKVGGTAYDLKAGECLVGGTAYAVKKGRTLIDGTGYDISLESGILVTILAGEVLNAMDASHESDLTTASTSDSWIVIYGTKIDDPMTLTIERGATFLGFLRDTNSSYGVSVLVVNGTGTRFHAGDSGMNINLWDYIPEGASEVTIRCAQRFTPLGPSPIITITTA